MIKLTGQREDTLYRKLQTKLRQTELLIDSAHYFASSLEFTEVMTRILERVLHVIEAADAGVLFIYDEHSKALQPMACSGFDWEKLQYVSLVSGESMTGLAFQTRIARIFHDPDNVISSSMSPLNRSLYEQSLLPLMKNLGPNFVLKSVMCAPLVIKDQCIGVMTLDNFTQDRFTEDDLGLLVTLSYQAAIALENARLYQEETGRRDKLQQLNTVIQSQNQQLHRINQAHERLMKQLLSGGSIVDIATAVFHIVENPIAVYDYSLNLLARQGMQLRLDGNDKAMIVGLNRVLKGGKRYHVEATAEKNSSTILFPILTSNKIVGILAVAEEHRVLEDQDIVLVEQCCIVLALELMKIEQVYEIEHRMKGEFLDELISDKNVGLLKERAKALGLSANDSFTFMVMSIGRPDGQERTSARSMWNVHRRLEQEVMNRNPRSLVITKLNTLVAILSWAKDMTTEKVLQRSRSLAHAILEAARSGDQEMDLTVGIGRVCRNFEEFVDSYEDAKQCITLMRTRNLQNTVKDYVELGAVRFILDQPKDKLIQYATDLLRPILDASAEKSKNLLKALDAFIITGRRNKEAATLLGIHPNTLAYRLKVIETLLGYQIDDYPAFFNLQFTWNVLETYDLKDKLMEGVKSFANPPKNHPES